MHDRVVETIWGREIHLHRPDEDGPPPILFKRLEVEKVLYVQCHPRVGSMRGTKEEVWCFLAPPRDGFVYAGLTSGATVEAILAARAEELPSLLERVPVAAGDVLRIPSGIVHALTPGARVFEAQEPNEVTIRLHDWDRGRACDPAAAREEADPSLRVARLGSLGEAGPEGIRMAIGTARLQILAGPTPAAARGFLLPLDDAASGYAMVDSHRGRG